MGTMADAWVSLSVMTMVYTVGELSHFLIGIVARPMSQELEYGDQGCITNPSFHNEEVAQNLNCHEFTNKDNCTKTNYTQGNLTGCVWDYTGLGVEYQILAGPAFVAVFTTAGVLIAMLSDRYNRRIVLTVCLSIVSASTLLTGAAREYWHLVLLRMLMGAGESSFSPACSSMISDMFEKSKQGLALGIFNWGIYFGYGLSYAFGNLITQADVLGLGWRFAYYMAGAMGVTATILCLIFVHEPARESQKSNSELQLDKKSPSSESVVYEISSPKLADPTIQYVESVETENLKKSLSTERIGDAQGVEEPHSPKHIWYGENGLREVFRVFLKPSVILLCVAACFRHTAGFTWAYNTQLYFTTYYPTYNLGYWVTGISIVGGTLGVAIGGLVSDLLMVRIGLKARLYVLAASQLIATPLAAGVLLLAPPYAFFSLLVAYMFAEMWLGVLVAVLLDIIPSSVQSTTLAVFLFIMNNIGGNLPVLVEPLRNTLNYRSALLILYPGNFLMSSVLFFLDSFLVKKMHE